MSLIKGLELRNFMSYDNAYVPVFPGLNLVCGPNGAGKSSILLGLSVVLGQAYTERAKRLSDLIRWNADEARITLHVKNEWGGARIFPTVTKETATITRVLKRNGDHYYLLQGKPVSKSAVIEAFSRMGLNPDNLLIIMHQLMVGRFATISPTEKLKMLEEAVGFQSYRSEVVEAYERLKRAQSEEESLASILQATKETFEYWRREYEKFTKKRDLEAKIREVQREIAWAKVIRKEAAIGGLTGRIDSKKGMLAELENRSFEVQKELKGHEEEFSKLRQERSKLLDQLIKGSKRSAQIEAQLGWQRSHMDQLRADLDLVSELADVPEKVREVVDRWRKDLRKLEGSVDGSEKELDGALAQEKGLVEKFHGADRQLQGSMSGLIQEEVELEVLDFKKKIILEGLADLEVQLKIANDELSPMIQEAERLGARVQSPRKFLELSAELAALQEEVKPVAHLSEDVEKMYFSYNDMFKELKGKAEQVARNRNEVLEELKLRMEKWRSILKDFLDEVSNRYREVLTEVGGTGSVRLSDSSDINKTGLEILAGFKGSEPQPIDSFSQSGGERSIALMAFLLALQQNIRSPLRAIDEFDVHLDPKNREVVSKLITSTALRAEGIQYIAITPGHITPEEGAHVVVVQRIGGRSQISEL